MPGADSTPEATSTAHGARVVTSPCTLPTFNPPATMTGLVISAGKRRQSKFSPLPPCPPAAWPSNRKAAALGQRACRESGSTSAPSPIATALM